MLKLAAYKGKEIGVFGLARSGLATVRALVAGGANVWAYDDAADRCAEAEALGARIVDLATADLSPLVAVVVSPGVPLTHPAPHPVVARAKAVAIPVIGDIELFARSRDSRPEAAVVAVTGTNGKSTTTALIGHILKTCGRAVAVGGNIGIPLLEFDPLPAGGIYVIEMSSYQTDLTESLAPDVAVLLNITPDHLDRHGDMEGYIAAKKRLFAVQHKPQVAVVSVDDAACRNVAAELEARVGGPKLVRISCDDSLAGGVSVVDRVLYDGLSGVGVPIGRIEDVPSLLGRHNWQNAAAAYAVARSLGLGPSEIFGALMTFPGLAHRMQLIGEYRGVMFVNDSKATNVDAASRALASYDNIFWIAGGKPKTTDLSALAPYLRHIRKAFLIGEAAAGFAKSLGTEAESVDCHDLVRAVDAAAKAALASGLGRSVVLLSPACASFDQFRDFEQRGEAFTQAVKEFIAAREGADKGEPRRAGGNGK